MLPIFGYLHLYYTLFDPPPQTVFRLEEVQVLPKLKFLLLTIFVKAS